MDEAIAIRTNIRTPPPACRALLRLRVDQPHPVAARGGNIHRLTQRRPHHFRLHADIQCLHGAAVTQRANNHIAGHRMGHDSAKLIRERAEELTPCHANTRLVAASADGVQSVTEEVIQGVGNGADGLQAFEDGQALPHFDQNI